MSEVLLKYVHFGSLLFSLTLLQRGAVLADVICFDILGSEAIIGMYIGGTALVGLYCWAAAIGSISVDRASTAPSRGSSKPRKQI